MTSDSVPERKFWQLAISDLEKQQAAGRNGLSSAEAASRRVRYGPNSLEERRQAEVTADQRALNVVPALIADLGEEAAWRYVEFFTANIRNPNTRRAYARACNRFFAWCENRGLAPAAIRPHDVATYIEELQIEVAAPSVKQQLAAIRMLFDWLVVGQVVPNKPAAAVRGPKHVVKTGKTPVLDGRQWRKLLASIPDMTLRDMRDRALIATLTYSFARIGAALNMKVEDLRPRGAGWSIRLHEKGGKQHTMPCHHALAEALRAFDSEMRKDGYWLGDSGYGYGHPMMDGPGFGYGYPMSGGLAATAAGYRDLRPGYEIRSLIAAASILARNGQQQACENVLATTRDTYKLYLADMHREGYKMANMPSWQQHQIAAATPVTGKDTSFRSDELVGIDVRNPQNELLGSADDIVMSPQSGKIAYLVIARGGFLGIDEKYVVVPWDDFKVSPNASLLVLDTTRSVMAAGPLVSHDQFATPGLFDQESKKVDAYWKTHLSNNGTDRTNG